MLGKGFKLNIIQKAFIYLLLACIIPILVFGLIAFNKTNAIIKNELNDVTYDLVENKQRNLELIMQNIESLIINISNVDDIRNILINESGNNSYNRLAAQAKMGYILSGYSNLKGLISIDIFSVGGEHYHIGETLNYQEIRNDVKERILSESLSSDRNVNWHGVEDNIHVNLSHKKVITSSKVVRVVDSNAMKDKPIGFIIVSYDINAFTEGIKDKTFQDSLYMVLDNKYRIIYHPDKDIIGSSINPSFISKFNKDTDNFTDNIDGENTIVTYSKSDISGWTTVGLISVKSLEAKTDAISNNMIILILFCFMMLIAFAFLISNKYLSPIKKITELFKLLQRENTGLKVRLSNKSDDEIGELTIWFNSFMDSLEEKYCMEQEIINREKLIRGVADATSVLLETAEHSTAFNMALQLLGEVAKADRAYIFENHYSTEISELLVSQRFEWCRFDIKPQIDNPGLQNISYMDAGVLRWHNVLQSGKIICGLVRDLPQTEQEILKSQGIMSILFVPIFIDRCFWGFMGFVDCSSEREWTKVEEDTLKIAAASIGGALKRIQAETELHQILKDDFRRTVKNLQNLVFKLIKSSEGEIAFTLFEGRIADEFGLSTSGIFGKGASEIVDEKTSQYLNKHFKKAFCGEVHQFELVFRKKVFYITLSPIIENGIVHEVVGSAIDITENKKAEEKIRYMAYYDALTGLPNRALFSDELNNAIAEADKNNNMVATMFLDLDQFKLINDTLGHAVGDMLLREVADRLKKRIGNQGMISRMGGDEFTILFHSVKDTEDASRLAEMIMDAFKKPFAVNQYELYIATSAGISIYPYDGRDLETLLKSADVAMYRAKDFGRNNYQFFSSSMKQQAAERLNLINNLRKAVEQNEFVLNYQPKVDISTGEVVGCEALIRWNHPDLGLIPPGNFIPLAEETGLIVPIGEWVLKTACAQVKKWCDDGIAKLNVSVNVSARQFQHQNIVELIQHILEDTGLNVENLELEITENSIMQNTDRTLAVIDNLKSIGLQISIDDFGTGFSSLAYLKRFRVDKLKIDRSFITDICNDSSDAAITSAIVSMARCLNLKVVAEGVETESQLSLLKKYGCNEIQGYFFSKPLNKEEFESFIQKNRSIA